MFEVVVYQMPSAATRISTAAIPKKSFCREADMANPGSLMVSPPLPSTYFTVKVIGFV